MPLTSAQLPTPPVWPPHSPWASFSFSASGAVAPLDVELIALSSPFLRVDRQLRELCRRAVEQDVRDLRHRDRDQVARRIVEPEGPVAAIPTIPSRRR